MDHQKYTCLERTYINTSIVINNTGIKANAKRIILNIFFFLYRLKIPPNIRPKKISNLIIFTTENISILLFFHFGKIANSPELLTSK